MATVECKTNFGWARATWETSHQTRDESLRSLFPDCEPYLCVLSSKNWDSTGFLKSPHFGRNWFCLCRAGIGKLSNPVSESELCGPIEPLFLSILRQLRRQAHA